MKKWMDDFRQWILGPERDFNERLFVVLTAMAQVALTLVFIGDIFFGENVIEIWALFGAVSTNPILMYLGLKYHKTKEAGLFISCVTVFIIMPTTFFFGGGVYSGAILWFSFSYLYIGLLLKGATRYVMLLCLSLLAVFEYACEYFFPLLVKPHVPKTFFLDSLLSLLVVGIVICGMVAFQNLLYIEENGRALKQAKEIEDLNRSQSRFFSSMSHEIRTPINTIIGLNEMILREDISEEVEEDAKNIQAASKVLLSLINDILDMSKIESGKMEIVRDAYDVREMLSEIVGMFSVRAKEKGLAFTVNVDPSMPSQLFSDEVRIKQILINLLNNAVKYTKEGSVSLSVHCTRTKDGSALVTYSVEDTGMGIRKESIPLLFDAFHREDIGKNKFIEGTGLGLSIVKQLVGLLGGEVSVNSVYTKGSTFVVTIEQEIANEQVIGEFDPRKFERGKQGELYRQMFEAPEAQVLIVDDSTTNLMVASKLLKGTKVQVDTATSGAECLTAVAKKKYHLILMDHMMPEMDGIECLHAVREQEGGLCRETPVIALTANAGSENQALYRREGFDGYLLKPVDSVKLEEAVLSMLPPDLVTSSQKENVRYESDSVAMQMRRKIPLLITTDSVCGLPHVLLEKWKIPVVPYRIRIDDGVFADGLEVTQDAVVTCFEEEGKLAQSIAPEVSEYERFFAEHLSYAQHIVHIAAGKLQTKGFENATEAALAFYNVQVVDSGLISTGAGLLALTARRLVGDGQTDMDALLVQLEQERERILTSFIVEDTKYLCENGHLRKWNHKVCRILSAHPMLGMRDGQVKMVGMIFGGRTKAQREYVRRTLRHEREIDPSICFITYVGMRRSEVEKIREDVLSIVPFENVYLQKASPAVALHTGPGTFGLMFARK